MAEYGILTELFCVCGPIRDLFVLTSSVLIYKLTDVTLFQVLTLR